MAPSAPAFCVALLLAASLAGVRPAPQAASTASCSTDIVRLLPCLSFVSGEVPAPPDTCCANLGSMVHDEPQCLCQALSQPGTSPVAVNMSRVLGLPRLCRLDLPSAPGAACAGTASSPGPGTATAGDRSAPERELHCSVAADAGGASSAAGDSAAEDGQRPSAGNQQGVQGDS
ncbi:hypothetical protein ACP4OV_024338 [Aristida adscensionis]